MLTLARNGLSTADVAAALHASLRTVTFRYALYTAAGIYKGDLTTVQAASISYQSESAIKRTARFSVREDPAINYLSDRIKPYCRIQVGSTWAEFPRGVFVLSTPPRKADAGFVLRDVEAYDLLQVLLDDKIIDRYAVASGTVVTTAVKAVLDGAGFTAQNLTPAAATLPVTREWEPGTPKLTIINDLLAAINYDPIWVDADGVAVVQPYVSPDQRGTDYTYATDSQSVIVPGVSQALDLFAVPNVFVLVVSKADRAPLRSVYTNSNPNSPTSTVSRGRSIVSVATDSDAVDQSTLDAQVARQAFTASQVYERVTLATALMPMHEHRDIIRLQHTGLGLDAAYLETSWSMPLKAGAQMSHELRRIVSVA